VNQKHGRNGFLIRSQAAPLSSNKYFQRRKRSMKEITRRLYTKPVMLGMAFVMAMALAVGLFATTRNSKAAQSGFPIVAGNDEFETPANGESFHDFGGSPIGADFFGPGSQPFNKLVAMEGVPLSGGSNVDTIIERQQTVSAPGGSTTLAMTGLSLKSISPITVTYSGHGPESWTVEVSLSQFKASTGTMKINASTMDSTLKVWPRFTFRRVPDGLTKVLDTGSGTGRATTVTAAKVDDNAAVIVPAPCKIEVIDVDSRGNSAASAAAAASSCPPVTLSSVNSPWTPCGVNGICFPPLTEAERWARHNPWPKGTKQVGVGD
jgi:hypothetical protein